MGLMIPPHMSTCNQGGDHFVDQTNIYGLASDIINFLESHKLNDKQLNQLKCRAT